jgi:Zn-finger nucleic acid-binding protein/ribosomal protein L40E
MIVECPGCRSRYDVTGRPPGTQARCRCGTVFALPAPGSQADKLDCPHCGAPVPPTNHRCAHCGTQLLVRACPRCFARVFHGARHCSHCGAESDLPAAATADGQARTRSCPRCDQPLVGQLVADVLLDQCDGCGGMFVDATALERILAERRQARADALLGAPPAETTAPGGPTDRLYIRCPVCDTVMNRRGFARGARVVVDVCRAHGTWFDAGELPKVVSFAMSGGLERAAAAEAEARLEQARRIERERRGTGVLLASDSPAERSDKLSTLVDALHSLFRWS